MRRLHGLANHPYQFAIEGVEINVVSHTAGELAEGLEVEAVLHEPIVRQPVCLNFDERGRLFLLSLGLGETPVHDQRFAVLAKHDVPRLQVAVQHAAAVGVGDRLTHLEELLQEPAEGDVVLLRTGYGRRKRERGREPLQGGTLRVRTRDGTPAASARRRTARASRAWRSFARYRVS